MSLANGADDYGQTVDNEMAAIRRRADDMNKTDDEYGNDDDGWLFILYSRIRAIFH